MREPRPAKIASPRRSQPSRGDALAEVHRNSANDAAVSLGSFRGSSLEAQQAGLRRLPPRQSHTLVTQIGMLHGNQHLQRLLATLGQPQAAVVQRKPGSHRFGGDPELEKVSAGTTTLKKKSRGITVTKLQQALIELGYSLPKFGIDGIFGSETEAAVTQFQTDVKIPTTGELDKATLAALQNKFDPRDPYVAHGTLDPKDPAKGTRNLSAAEKAAVHQALAPRRGVKGKPAKFQEVVGGKKYGDEIKDRLAKLIAHFHKELFASKEPLRKDPKKHMHDWSVLEAPAEAAKDATDSVYGSYAKGPKMTAAGGNLVDQWDDEVARNAALSAPEQKRKAAGKVRYLIVSNCTDINDRHSAVPSDAKEKAILDPIVESFVDTPAKVQTMLEIEMGWEGAQLEGIVYLQRFKAPTAEKNREQLWELFHTCIHEYIHALAHPDFQKYAESFRRKGDEVRYNTLIEGFDDFFTLNVRSTVKITDPLRQKVEGPYYDKAAPVPAINSSVYPSHAQAEQVVSIVGIRNAQAAYFLGNVKLIGGK